MEQVLAFRLGEELYGLEVENIQEIVESPTFHYIPRAPACFLGAINFHGCILPVLDLPAYLGIAGEKRDPRIIVLPSCLCPLALAVTLIRRIVPLDAETFLPFQEEQPMDMYVRATFRGEEEVINLFDVARLLVSLEKC
jgi:purine-binding chemotaxis protein CheW